MAVLWLGGSGTGGGIGGAELVSGGWMMKRIPSGVDGGVGVAEGVLPKPSSAFVRPASAWRLEEITMRGGGSLPPSAIVTPGVMTGGGGSGRAEFFGGLSALEFSFRAGLAAGLVAVRLPLVSCE